MVLFNAGTCSCSEKSDSNIYDAGETKSRSTCFSSSRILPREDRECSFTYIVILHSYNAY